MCYKDNIIKFIEFVEIVYSRESIYALEFNNKEILVTLLPKNKDDKVKKFLCFSYVNKRCICFDFCISELPENICSGKYKDLL